MTFITFSSTCLPMSSHSLTKPPRILFQPCLCFPAHITPTALRTMTSSPPKEEERYKLVFFAPPVDLAPIKEAIFATGAGSYPGAGNYTKCAFTTPGIGQFLPGDEANPHIGQPGKVEEVGEARCEILCVGKSVAQQAVEALKRYLLMHEWREGANDSRTHPYEMPAYEVYKM